MNDIFVGLILLFVNFNINLGALTVGLLPSFVGAYLIWKGARELSAESETMRELDMVLKVAIGVHAVIWVCNFFGAVYAWGLLFWLLNVASQLMNLYILHQLTGGVEELEKIRCVDMRVEMLKRWWIAIFAFSVLNVFLGRSFWSVLCTIGWFVALLGYLLCFRDGGRAYMTAVNDPAVFVGQQEDNEYDA